MLQFFIDLFTARSENPHKTIGPLPPPMMPNSRAMHYKTPVGGIPAKSGLTMGSAVCEKYACSSSGVLSLTGVSHSIYNPAGAIGGNLDIVVEFNDAGLRVAIVVPC